jgi:ubiquinone/menaquinone biosynthesis C-methylase UbiE
MPEVLTPTKTRCRAMIQAVRGQAADIWGVLDRHLPPSPTDHLPDSAALPEPLKYIHYLYRDWGWPAEPEGENEHALAAIESVREERPIGRMLVIGAGACRLAYDLHRSDTTADTTVLDIEPLLFSVAERVIRGGRVTVREANAEIDDVDHVVKEWVLHAPHGAIQEDRFHFIFADGLEPPFASETFDTIVTPWFIDVVPSDLPHFITTVHRLLKPDGRWLNLGPLKYIPELPVTRRYAREELFELAERAGFRMDGWRVESMPYLVSKLNGRGKIESVLAFAATKIGRADMSKKNPPDWLVFRHLPIPTFPGQSLFVSEDPVVQMVASAIDGRNSIDDIARLVSAAASDTGLTMDQFREIVRRCLLEIHHVNE